MFPLVHGSLIRLSNELSLKVKHLSGAWTRASICFPLFLCPTVEFDSPVPSPAAPASPKSVTVVDVVTKLDGLAAAHKEKLNWKTSIVDLMKLLVLDSSLVARKELMNVWLHKAVLQKLADNGGNIPKEFL